MKDIMLITCLILIFLFQTGVMAAEIEKEVHPLNVLEETTIFEISSKEVKVLQKAATGEALTGLYKIELYRVRLSDGREGWINSGSVEEPTAEYFKEGYKYYTDEQYDSSIEMYKKILEINPAAVKAHFWLAKNYWKMGEAGPAKDELQQALDLDENDPDALQMQSMLAPRKVTAMPTLPSRQAGGRQAKKEEIKNQPLLYKTKIIGLVNNSVTKKGTIISKALDGLSKLTKSLGIQVVSNGWGVEADPKEKGKYLAHYICVQDKDGKGKVETEYFTWQVDLVSGSIIAVNKNAELLMNKW